MAAGLVSLNHTLETLNCVLVKQYLSNHNQAMATFEVNVFQIDLWPELLYNNFHFRSDTTQ